MKNTFQNIIYKSALFFAKIYWRVFKPNTSGARIILVAENSILLVQHRGSQFWNLPGGGIKNSRDPEQEAFRELREETGIVFQGADYLLGTYTSEGEGKHDTIYVFVKKVPNQIIPQIGLEIQNAQWFSCDNLPETISPATQLRIGEYQEGIRNIVTKWNT